MRPDIPTDRPAPEERLGVRYGIGFRRCNLDCPYCFAEWRQKMDVLDVDRFHAILERIEALAPRISLRFGIGGEAFICPPFLDKVVELSHKDGPIRSMSWSSNIQADWDRTIAPFLDRVDTSRIGMGCTLHDTVIDDIDLFFRKAKRIQESGVEVYIGYVALPGRVELLREYKARADGLGIPLLLNPYAEAADGKRNLDDRAHDYHPQEVEDLRELFGSDHVHKLTVEQAPTLGMRCSAGSRYIVVHPNGDVLACDRMAEPMGNLLEGEIRLLDRDIRCPFRHCWCPNENQALRIVDRKYRRTGRTLRVLEPRPGLTPEQLRAGYNDRLTNFAYRVLRSPRTAKRLLRGLQGISRTT